MLASVALAEGGTAQAGDIEIDFGTAAYSNGTQSGSASFSHSGDEISGQLTITLMNTMDGGATGVSWLTGVFFELSGATIDISTHTSTDTARHFNDGTLSDATFADPDHWWGMTELVDGWATQINGEDFSNAFLGGTQNYALTAAGFSIPNDGFSLDGTELNGSDGGLLSSMLPDLPGGHDDQDFMIGSLTYTFTLTDFTGEVLDISNVAIVFGTDLDQGLILVPLPPALALGLFGLAGIAVVRRRLA